MYSDCEERLSIPYIAELLFDLPNRLKVSRFIHRISVNKHTNISYIIKMLINLQHYESVSHPRLERRSTRYAVMCLPATFILFVR